MTSATWPANVRRLADKYMSDPATVFVGKHHHHHHQQQQQQHQRPQHVANLYSGTLIKLDLLD